MSSTLVLLAGTNPLPNYVTAIHCYEDVKKIWLLYSEENREIGQSSTRDIAFNIANELKKSLCSDKVDFLSLKDISSAIEIERELKKYKNKFKNSQIHVNYTGGTKVMAVYVHRFFSNYFDSVTFSYLDPRGRRLLYDNGDIRRIENIQLTVDEMLSLHGYLREGGDNKIPDTVLNYLETIKGSKEKIDGFYAFCQCISGLKTTIEGANLEEIMLKIESIIDRYGSFLKELGLDDTYKTFLEKARENPSRNALMKLFKTLYLSFLEGQWLEYLVFLALNDMVYAKGNKEKNKHYGWSLKARKRDNSKEFELDNFFIEGYQLFGISATTDSTEKWAKLKAFEVLHRVAQIGGGEARAILVCGLPDDKIEGFKHDLENIEGSMRDRLSIIGKSQWYTLEKSLAGYIYG